MFDKDYFEIDSDVVFKTIQEDIPQMTSAIVKIIDDVNK